MVSHNVHSHLCIRNDMRFKYSKRNKCMYFLVLFSDLTHGLCTDHLCPHRLVLFKRFLCVG